MKSAPDRSLDGVVESGEHREYHYACDEDKETDSHHYRFDYAGSLSLKTVCKEDIKYRNAYHDDHSKPNDGSLFKILLKGMKEALDYPALFILDELVAHVVLGSKCRTHCYDGHTHHKSKNVQYHDITDLRKYCHKF